ncbi:hypothetical protein, partial [Senegalimassilia anaerobia]|uniref:hypothetical protein n=1 Tax=Senegalimassilia anaerobia TaxID=1473216 RepID=UPI003A96CAD7
TRRRSARTRQHQRSCTPDDAAAPRSSMNTRHPRRAIKGIIELARDHSAEPERLLDDRQRTDELSSRRPPWSSSMPWTRKAAPRSRGTSRMPSRT